MAPKYNSFSRHPQFLLSRATPNFFSSHPNLFSTCETKHLGGEIIELGAETKYLGTETKDCTLGPP